MGYKSDQNFYPETYRPESTASGKPQPLPLPPRANSTASDALSPPPYSEIAPTYHSQPLTHSWSAQDPRSSSTQSLVPEDTAADGKRTLLLIYIHGFMGNETSFRSFPAHVHNVVTAMVAETHVVHTKIYPKYKSRKAIEFARDDFSKWLSPHESPKTDVILLGHSMGGILSAEVALLKQLNSESFQHRILGTINFDTPFLGMHPGVVVSGLGSLFRPAPESPNARPQQESSGGQEIGNNDVVSASPSASLPLHQSRTQSSTNSGYFSPPACLATSSRQDSGMTNLQQILSPDLPTKDPNYNPPFPNDIRLPTRTGWDNALHFVMKHSDGLTKATKSYVTSHLEFGGAMADYKGLQTRYAKLRALEDVNEKRSGQRRIRFVNYYTASTGRLKRPKSPSPRRSRSQISSQLDGSGKPVNQSLQELTLSASDTRSPSRSPRISVEEHADGQVIPGVLQDDDEVEEAGNSFVGEGGAESYGSEGMNIVDPSPITDNEHEGRDIEDKPAAETTEPMSPSTPADTASITPGAHSKFPSLPPVPSLPPEPPAFDPSPYPDKDTRKLAEKEHSRQVKAYKQAVKDRDKAIKDRRKLLEKREKNAKMAREKQVKLDARELTKSEEDGKKNQPKPPAKLKKNPTGIPNKDGQDEPLPEKPKRDKKFCMLPPRINGERDPCWVRVFMRDVDEVGAHCGLFLVGEQYEGLVGDVGERVRGWVEG